MIALLVIAPFETQKLKQQHQANNIKNDGEDFPHGAKTENKNNKFLILLAIACERKPAKAISHSINLH